MPVENIMNLTAYTEGELKIMVTGLFATFLLFLGALWVFDFIAGGMKGD